MILYKEISTAIKESYNNVMDHLILAFAVGFLDAFFIAVSSFIISYVVTDFNRINNIIARHRIIETTLFFVLLYLVWSLIQTFSWHITYRISEKEKGPKLSNYMKRFFGINLIWFILIYIVGYFFISLDSSTFYLTNYFVRIMFTIIFASIFVLMNITYCIIFDKHEIKKYYKQTLKIIKIKNLIKIIIIFTLAFIGYQISDLIQFALSPFPGAMLLVGFILTFGIVILTRLSILKIIENTLK